MPLETAIFIDDLVPTNPLSTDQKLQGDDHLRLIKAVLKNTFPNIDDAITGTPALFNALGSGLGTWGSQSMRAMPNGQSFNALTQGGWWRFDGSNGQGPGGSSPIAPGVVLVLSSDGDLATPQNGRSVWQVAFAVLANGAVNAYGFNGGIAIRRNINGTGWSAWTPNWEETYPVGSFLTVFISSNPSVAAGTDVAGVSAMINGGAFIIPSVIGGTWRILAGLNVTYTEPVSGTPWFAYNARRVS